MEKDNKYYGIIENLIRSHKKFNGYDAILDEIIDDVYKHSESVINTVNDENVVISYLQKIVSVSVITVPKRLGLHTEIKHRSITNEILPEKHEERPVVNQVNKDFNKPTEDIKTPTDKANVELVDKMINSIASASVTGNISETASNSDTTVFTEDETEILDSDSDIEPIVEADVLEILTDNSDQTEEDIKRDLDEHSEDNAENLEPVEELDTFETEQTYEADEISEDNAENLEPVEELDTLETEQTYEADGLFEDNTENLEPVEEIDTFETEQTYEADEIFEDNTENLEPVEELKTLETEQTYEADEIFEDNTENLEPVEELETLETEQTYEADGLFEDNTENLEPVEELETFETVTDNMFEEETLEPVEETDLAEIEPAAFDLETGDTVGPEEDIIAEDNHLEVDFNDEMPEESGLNILSDTQEEGLLDISDSLDLNEEISLMPTSEIVSEESVEEKKEELSYKPMDYSLFNYAPEVHTDTDKIKSIEMKLSDLNSQRPELNIMRIFDLKYKQNLPITKIAEELNIDKQDVISALDEIIELI